MLNCPFAGLHLPPACEVSAGLRDSPPLPPRVAPGLGRSLSSTNRRKAPTPSLSCVSVGSVARVALSPSAADLFRGRQTQLPGSLRPALDALSPNTHQAPPFTYRESPGRRQSQAWLLQQPPRHRRRPRLRNRKHRELKSKPEKEEPREGKLCGAQRSTFGAVIGGSARVTDT
ncbi:hypothetical protein NN561_006686 [Cricetulus griseus]